MFILQPESKYKHHITNHMTSFGKTKTKKVYYYVLYVFSACIWLFFADFQEQDLKKIEPQMKDNETN